MSFLVECEGLGVDLLQAIVSTSSAALSNGPLKTARLLSPPLRLWSGMPREPLSPPPFAADGGGQGRRAKPAATIPCLPSMEAMEGESWGDGVTPGRPQLMQNLRVRVC